MHDSRGGSYRGVSLRGFIMYLLTNGSYAIYCKELKHALEGLKHSLDIHVFQSVLMLCVQGHKSEKRDVEG